MFKHQVLTHPFSFSSQAFSSYSSFSSSSACRHHGKRAASWSYSRLLQAFARVHSDIHVNLSDLHPRIMDTVGQESRLFFRSPVLFLEIPVSWCLLTKQLCFPHVPIVSPNKTSEPTPPSTSSFMQLGLATSSSQMPASETSAVPWR